MIQQGTRSGKFGSACIVETLSVHYQMAKPTQEVPGYTLGPPIGGLALTIAAVSTKWLYYKLMLIS